MHPCNVEQHGASVLTHRLHLGAVHSHSHVVTTQHQQIGSQPGQAMRSIQAGGSMLRHAFPVS